MSVIDNKGDEIIDLLLILELVVNQPTFDMAKMRNPS
jgi:hypothetical protein